MKSRVKKFLCFVLALCLCWAFIPNGVTPVEASSTTLNLTQLRQKFPHGKYWNHAGNPGYTNDVNNQDGYTSTPCSQHGVVGTSKQTCNGFQPGSTQLSWQCMGYAEKLGYDATGYNPRNNANGWYTYTSSSALNNLKPGDIVRYKNNNHSIYVTAVNGDTVTYTDCNSDYHCVIRWDATISKSTLRSTFTHVRSAPSAVTPGTTSCSCSTAYAGTYICTTSSLNLTIRSGHGSSYSAIGSIPSGATVTVTKASGTGSSDWAHVTYNGITGYASMQYLKKQEERNPTIRLWLSDSAYGEALSDFTVGNRYYLCYRLYDGVSGKDWDEVCSSNYTVNIAIYNPDGSLNYDNTSSSDSGWISVFYTTPGAYTRKVVANGDFSIEGSREFYVAPNPQKIHSSKNSVSLTLGGTDRAEIMTWTSGYHNNPTFLNWSRSNDNVSCSWGEWNDDGLLPLYITANAPGTTTITLSVKDKNTSAVLDTTSVEVTVTAINYKITYNANGGTGAPNSQTKSHSVDLTLSTSTPTRIGYTFLGWSTSSTATTATYQPGGSFTTNANTTLYAVWKSNKTTLRLNSANIATISAGDDVKYFTYTPAVSGKYVIYSTGSDDTKVYLYNASGTELANNDDGGSGNNFRLEYNLNAGSTYIFGIRYYNNSKTGIIPFEFGNVFAITYNANGGIGAPASQSKDYGADITLSNTVPTKAGYTFLGWSTSSTATTATHQAGESFAVDANTTLYAVWKAVTYTVSYNANGGTGAPSSQTKSHGAGLTLSTTRPTRIGYTFLGWSTSSTATTATYQPGGSFTANANTTLYAVWESNATALNANFDNSAAISVGGDVEYYTYTPTVSGKYVIYSTGSDDTKVYLYNASGTELANNDDGGSGNNFRLEYNLNAGSTYIFGIKYYNNSKTGIIPFKFGNIFSIAYNANGGVGAPTSQSKDYGADITLSNTVPTKAGYTFLGWSTSSTAATATYQAGGNFSGNTNTTLYAVWKAATYTVSYNANGGTGAPSSQTKSYGVALTLSTAKPTRNGYTFLGWATSSTATTATYQPGGSFTVNANTILYAVWKTSKTLSNISVISKPTKTVYSVGETLNTAGLKLKLTYSDGSTETVSSGFTTAGFDSSVAGTKTVTVSYGGKSTAFTVTVKGNNPTLRLTDATVAKGNTVTIDLAIENNPGFCALAIAIDYNSKYLTLVSVENKMPSMTMTQGKNIIWDNSSNYTGNGVIARLTFKAANNAPDGDYSVTVRSLSAANEEFEEVSIGNANAVITVANIIYGDSNGDGKINTVDLAMLRKYLANKDPATGESTVSVGAGADVNGDGKINTVDLAMLRKYLADRDPVTGESSVILGPKKQ